jgi:hypothetical protein
VLQALPLDLAEIWAGVFTGVQQAPAGIGGLGGAARGVRRVAGPTAEAGRVRLEVAVPMSRFDFEGALQGRFLAALRARLPAAVPGMGEVVVVEVRGGPCPDLCCASVV